MYASAYVWAKVLGYLEERLTSTIVSAWFDDAEVVELTDEKLILYSPSELRREIITRRCADHIIGPDLLFHQHIHGAHGKIAAVRAALQNQTDFFCWCHIDLSRTIFSQLLLF